MIIETIDLWEDRDDVKLTTFLAAPDPFMPNPVKKPAVIVCPGGAYRSCPRHGNEGDPVAMTFAADGYQAFVLEYSVAESAPQEKTLFPAQVRDLGKAMLEIRAHADEWAIDPEKISVIGFSAGGHLCGMYATTWHTPVLSEYFHEDSSVFKPLTAMLIYPVADYVIQDAYLKENPSPVLGPDINVPVFGTANPNAEMLKAYSPSELVSEHTVPVFLAAAMDDGMVTAKNSLAMAAKLQEKGVPYELHIFEYGDHGFSLGRNLFEPFRQDKAHACAQWVPMAKTFLMHHIAPETTVWEQSPFTQIEEAMRSAGEKKE
ncbi:MAG: alpha/beta hydrolase [Catenibacillus sp.]